MNTPSLLHRIKFFFKPVLVLADHFFGKRYDFLSTPVIFCQHKLSCIWKIRKKLFHDSRRSPPETINSLIVITYYKQIILRYG